MSYAVTGLPVEPFRPLFGLSEEALAERGIRRMEVTAPTGFPCRIRVEDAKPGETVLLLNYEHQPADTPFRSRHAIFVCEQATETRRTVGELPPSLAIRPHLSIRAFDAEGMMTDGQVAAQGEVEAMIERMLEDPQVAYLHAHYAGRGCYAARIDRA